jgi:hypothetical protein
VPEIHYQQEIRFDSSDNSVWLGAIEHSTEYPQLNNLGLRLFCINQVSVNDC